VEIKAPALNIMVKYAKQELCYPPDEVKETSPSDNALLNTLRRAGDITVISNQMLEIGLLI